ncbi:MAG: hypothetical protein PW843_10550 [Azospirillaceae bacterium]|nr:hypothetical protein [Azospirillaceae bacterium]
MIIQPFRTWVARYGRWWITTGIILAVLSFFARRYEQSVVGFLIAATGVWGLLLEADLPGKTKFFQRPYLTFLLWFAIGAAVYFSFLYMILLPDH